MKFEEGLVYHVYNQGNNKQQIFFEERHYHYFLAKMEQHLIPFCHLLAYCLMPNHFHWLIRVNRLGLVQSKGLMPCSVRKLIAGDYSASFYKAQLNHQIGILLSSYTRAVNNQLNRSGSLFRCKTKAKNGIIDGFITLDGRNKSLFFSPENSYMATCLEYIHQNPVKAGFVKNPVQWPYSSANEHRSSQDPKLCDLEMAKVLGLI